MQELSDGSLVSVLLCRMERQDSGQWRWLVMPNSAERNFITLLCKVNRARDRICAYYLFPKIDREFSQIMQARSLARWGNTAKRPVRVLPRGRDNSQFTKTSVATAGLPHGIPTSMSLTTYSI